MNASVTRLKKHLTDIISTSAQADVAVATIGTAQNQLNILAAEYAAKKEALDAEYAKRSEPFELRAKTTMEALYAYAGQRKRQLTLLGKSITVPTGVFGWRVTPSRFHSELAEATMIARLKRRGLSQYIRVTESVDRKAMIRDGIRMIGVTYPKTDEFFVKPKAVAPQAKTVTRVLDTASA